MVEVNPPYCRLMDMGSTNGTYVNGQRVKMIDLKHGDQIRAGKTVLRVDVENGLEAGSTPEVPPLKAAPEPAPAPVVGHAASTMPAANVPASEPFPMPLPPQPVPGPFAAGPDYSAQAAPPPAVSEPAYAAPVFPLNSPTPEPVVADFPLPPPPLVVESEPPPAPAAPPTFASAMSPQTVNDAGRARESFPGTLTPPAVSPPPNPPPAPPTAPTMEAARPASSPGESGRGYLSAVPTPAAPAARPAPTKREPCLACGTQTSVSALSSGTSPWGSVPMICPACWDQISSIPQPIAGYRIIKKLGHGGMGVVQLALREADNSLVALKTIIPAVAGSQTKVERFLREADILKELDHPNIVAFREMSESNGQLYFAMDYVPGTDAAHLLKQNGGPMEITRGVRLICQLLDALDYAHAKGFVHRDIKPANLMVAELKGKEVLKLADFGLARVYQASELSGLTMTGDMGGTLAFMAPEQITHFREAKPAADLYASAATLYNLITDRFVFDLPRPAEQRLMMILTDEPVPIQSRKPDIPDGLAAVIHRALAKEPEMRFPDAKTMRRMLQPFGR
jgi:serine/threonine-protein kinase